MKESSNDRRVRRLRAQFRHHLIICSIVMLIIGLLLGIVLTNALTPKDRAVGERVIVYITPEPTATPEPTPIPTAIPAPTQAPEADDEPLSGETEVTLSAEDAPIEVTEVSSD
ncbi:MAG: hypothetical protein ACSW8J_08500, partial [bacterium]